MTRFRTQLHLAPCAVLSLAVSLAGCSKPQPPTVAAEPPTASPTAPESPAEVPPAEAAPAPAPSAVATFDPMPEETHLGPLLRLTDGGENAEAYFSGDESQLIFQSTRDGYGCDQIFTMNLQGENVTRVSGGIGRTTCSYFMQGDARILYASTHAADPSCLPAPDHSHGYVWKLYDEFEIYSANPDGSDIEPLITSKGYDAEATMSPAGDKFVFTSTRDGDPEIYVANADGTGIKRLTRTKGYDGGAFFSPDGKRIIYRANHPKGKDELAKYDDIIKLGLVRPTRLELFVMNADGSKQQQITKNGKANFGPYWHPDGKRVIFASNIDDPEGRNFDLYIIGLDGEGLERVTHNPTFDGFPMFTRDGKTLVFASNRHNSAEGDTNIFITQWRD